jgi:hypothetical protein
MPSCYNKVTREWNSFDDTSGLSSDWVIDPTFPNKERAMEIGPKYWVYNGNEITGLTEEEILANTAFHNEMHSIVWEKIKKERDRRKSEGGYKVGTNWYHSDDTSRIQQIGLVMLGANMPNNIMWKTMLGDFVLMTPTLAGQIFQAAMVSDMTIFTVAEQKRQAMLALSDPRNYSWDTGWPLIYGE